jgi:hypothetical protein
VYKELTAERYALERPATPSMGVTLLLRAQPRERYEAVTVVEGSHKSSARGL